MNQKVMLGSILCLLLMLVSTQTVFLNIVKSDPQIHQGEAFVGDLWVSELNVSSVLEEVAFVGIGHANASDDYVAWETGEGDIVANWTVQIEERSHPDYNVMFSLIAYNIDDNNSEMDTAYCVEDYEANTGYNDSGYLRLHVEFDNDFLKVNTEATLVCYLNAAVKINNTEEAVNFTTWGQDRCIIGVVFDSGSSFEPYSHFREEGNDNFPNIWSWLPGWNESSRFDDEQDMLENQTFFYVSGSEQSEEGDWHLGEFDITMGPGLLYDADFSYYTQNYPIQFDDGEQVVNPYISLNYDYHQGAPQKSVNRFILIHEGIGSLINRTNGGSGRYAQDYMGTSFLLHDYDDRNSDDYIIFVGRAWSNGLLRSLSNPLLCSVEIESGTGDLQSSMYSNEGYYWMENCGYFNTTYSLDIDSSTNFGITTIDCDISNVLLDNEQYVYTYAADIGDTQIALTC
ncbi:MAG: hypothetical protein MUC80_00600 [Candidatus Thermoplasmatota archaeon]|jgi:hypothetical protein|nr:hypothetical protein [Candidatus Thermoplasmatota archaeon]